MCTYTHAQHTHAHVQTDKAFSSLCSVCLQMWHSKRTCVRTHGAISGAVVCNECVRCDLSSHTHLIGEMYVIHLNTHVIDDLRTRKPVNNTKLSSRRLKTRSDLPSWGMSAAHVSAMAPICTRTAHTHTQTHEKVNTLICIWADEHLCRHWCISVCACVRVSFSLSLYIYMCVCLCTLTQHV